MWRRPPGNRTDILSRAVRMDDAPSDPTANGPPGFSGSPASERRPPGARAETPPAIAGDSESGLTRMLAYSRRLVHLAEASAVERQLLPFSCGAFRCAASLPELRGGPAILPPIAPLPFSPPWLLGAFPLRDASEILGLVDPLPILTGDATATGGPWIAPDPARQRSARRVAPSAFGAPTGQEHLADGGVLAGAPRPLCVLILGSGDRSLALAVDAIHDLVTPQPQELLAISDISDEAPLPFRRRYLSAIYTPAGGESCFVLHIPRLLGDLLRALDQAEGDAAADPADTPDQEAPHG